MKRWAEHFNSVLNRPSSVNDNAINRLPQIECNVLLDEFPTVTETRKAIQHLSSGKAPGTDAIPAEVYKAGGLPMAEQLTELFQCMWRKKAIPQDLKDLCRDLFTDSCSSSSGITEKPDKICKQQQ